jgi:hypothetical protein
MTSQTKYTYRLFTGQADHAIVYKDGQEYGEIYAGQHQNGNNDNPYSYYEIHISGTNGGFSTERISRENAYGDSEPEDYSALERLFARA